MTREFLISISNEAEIEIEIQILKYKTHLGVSRICDNIISLAIVVLKQYNTILHSWRTVAGG